MKKRRLFAIFTAMLFLGQCALFAACSKESPMDEQDPSQGEQPSDSENNEQGGNGGNTQEPEPVLSAGYEGTVGDISFVLPDLGGAVSVHTEAQTSYLKGPQYNIKDYANGVNGTDEEDHRDISKPDPVTITWQADSSSGTQIKKYKLTLSEAEDLSDPYEFSCSQPLCIIYNLKVATTYYWAVSVGNDTSGTAFFTTEDICPRNLFVEGVTNVRDMGGWKTESGKRIRQGLIYRSGRFSENYTGEKMITESGLDTMLKFLKIKTEIDLRGGADDTSESKDVKSPLGSTVTFHRIGMRWEGNLYTINTNEIKQVFEIFADEQSYPIVFHCSIGTDRTGVLAFLLNAFLGVPLDDLYKEYLFSNFAYIQGERDISYVISPSKGYLPTIKKFDGATISEKAKNALLATGLSEQTLNTIKQNLLTD